MRRKLPRWTFVSLFLVLSAGLAYHLCRGPNESRADDRATGPIVPPGGPKPIPFDTSADNAPFHADSFQADSSHTRPNNLRTAAASAGSSRAAPGEPRRLKISGDDATPLHALEKSPASPAPFPTAEQTLNKEPAAAGDPFGLHNEMHSHAAPYGVRTVANEAPESKEPAEEASGPRRFPPLNPNAAAADSGHHGPVAGNPPIPTESPAWARGVPAGETASGPSKNPSPFAPNNAARPNPWSEAAPAKANAAETRPAPVSPFASEGKDSAPVASNLPPAAPATPGAEGSGRPGGKQLEGTQSPQLTVEKLAPREIQVGRPAVFEVKVRNIGSVMAQGVEIYDEVPKGTQLLRTVPAASRGARNDLTWSIGALKPGEESKVQVEVMPITEGEVGSVATVHFRADASARTICTKPELTLQISAPRQVMIGEEANFSIKITNPGSGVASGIVLSDRVPTGLQHSSGTELEFDVGELKPGESRQLDLALKAVTAGAVTNMISARADANLKVVEKVDLEVIAPGLKVAMTGPSKRYLERPANYTFSVTNPGTATAKDIELTTYLPKGLKFVKANNSGQYDPRRNCVVWSLEELPATETGAVQMTALPIEEGEQKLRIEGKAQQGLSDSQESTITVDGVAAVLFEVADLADPIEIGGETTYEVRVTNQGSKAASNITIVAYLPPELKALSAEGPTRHVVEGSKVTFEPLPRLSAKGDTVFRIRAQAQKAGDARVKVQLTADELTQPVTKEESTRVYADQ
ncbi:MAG TPA: hypothetical protein VFE24_06290 [Pirellulales bacterium]|jgi:uncharacterized repeat protein (TIGR01451 family)|nr:hypothetical protein [Pirellulales bacterium]